MTLFRHGKTNTIWYYLYMESKLWHQRGRWHPTPVLLSGKSHGQRSLVGCNPWGREESDTTERLHFHFSLSRIGEWNGNPLQCSCLENPRDGGTWWAAVYGVHQSRTRLKWLSSSSELWHKPTYLWNKSRITTWTDLDNRLMVDKQDGVGEAPTRSLGWEDASFHRENG